MSGKTLIALGILGYLAFKLSKANVKPEDIKPRPGNKGNGIKDNTLETSGGGVRFRPPSRPMGPTVMDPISAYDFVGYTRRGMSNRNIARGTALVNMPVRPQGGFNYAR